MTKTTATSGKEALAELDRSLSRMKLDYVDLYLVHWTCTWVDWDNAKVEGPPLHQTWADMEKVHEAGLTKNIGVSNITAALFIDLLASAKVKPVTNQIENNPYLAQSDLVKFTEKFGCTTTAYAPIGAAGFTGGNLLEDPTLKEIAEKHSATPAQISLAWNMNRGVIVIPKSMTKERIQQNFEALDIKLDDSDIEKLDALDKGQRNFDPTGWDSPQYGWKQVPYFK